MFFLHRFAWQHKLAKKKLRCSCFKIKGLDQSHTVSWNTKYEIAKRKILTNQEAVAKTKNMCEKKKTGYDDRPTIVVLAMNPPTIVVLAMKPPGINGHWTHHHLLLLCLLMVPVSSAENADIPLPPGNRNKMTLRKFASSSVATVSKNSWIITSNRPTSVKINLASTNTIRFAHNLYTFLGTKKHQEFSSSTSNSMGSHVPKIERKWSRSSKHCEIRTIIL